METPARRAKCPSCGAPLELKLGTSIGCICPYCRASVVRRGVELQALGRMADLVPTAPRMTVGDAGRADGLSFRVGGRLQLDHGRGPWDEWYVELADGRWGWLAYAQGRYYLTHPVVARELPPLDALQVGETLSIPGSGAEPWTVADLGNSELLSAEGELPLPAVPGERGRYADLVGSDGGFATLDYGDGSEPPRLYAGREIATERVELTSTALGPRPEERAQVERMRCPKCGAPVALLVPEESERTTCGSCRSLLDHDHGTLRYVRALSDEQKKLPIPLGTQGTLLGESVLVIGYLERTTTEDYSWREYLLHTKHGYRWLVEDARHYTHVREVSPADVKETITGARFDGTSFRRFSSSTARVSYVLGEFYWKVEAGERAQLADFVAPPRVLSREESTSELHWSVGEYLPARDVWKGLGLPGSPPWTSEVAPAQPNPVRLGYYSAVWAVLFAVLCVMGVVLEGGVGEEVASVRLPLLDAGQTSASPEDSVVYTESFEVARGPTTIEVELDTDVSNGWVSTACALIDDGTNSVREFYVQAEEWHGVSDGEAWQEGDPRASEYLGRVPAGRYVLRFDTRWGRQGEAMSGPTPSATAHVRVGSRSAMSFLLAALLISLPLLFALIAKGVFESKRWKNSDYAGD